MKSDLLRRFMAYRTNPQAKPAPAKANPSPIAGKKRACPTDGYVSPRETAHERHLRVGAAWAEGWQLGPLDSAFLHNRFHLERHAQLSKERRARIAQPQKI